MACGATRNINGVVATCDNAGTSTHAGRHSGLITFSLFGRVLNSSRVYWENNTARTVSQKVAVLGQGDFIIPSNQTAIVTGVNTGGGGGSVTIDETTNFANPGTFTYNIPAEANYLDVILLGGGGGGASPGTFYTLKGFPGAAGTWATTTLTIGTHIPRSTTTMTIVVGAGGRKGSGVSATGVAGVAGGDSVVSGTGMTTLTATGGGGGGTSGTGTSAFQGPGPGNQTFNSVTYVGGATQTTAGGAGNPAGGAGAGGNSFGGAGGDGARGQVWVRARTN